LPSFIQSCRKVPIIQSNSELFVGVDGCKAGWLAIAVTEKGKWHMGIHPDIGTLWNNYSDASLILIDIPIGLPDKEPYSRACDMTARRLLGQPRASSVFPVPCWQAVREKPHAKWVNHRTTGKKLTKQTLGIIDKIEQVNKLLVYEVATRKSFREIHPEICFWALNSSKAMFYNKKRSMGIVERLGLLSCIYPISRDIYDYALNEYSRKEVARDDILDALVGAVTGLLGRDKLVTIPEKPDLGYQGLPMEMVYCVPT